MTSTSAEFDLEELKSQIDQLDGGLWQVERTLKSTPYEETQLVRRKGTGVGPFVRKIFAEDADRGDAYEALFRAQVSGVRFAHIPLVYDCARTDGGLAVVMEYVQGETLRQHVERLGAGERIARFMAPALCNALIELHGAMDAPIIHRDVKPSNVVVVPTGVVLIDLGIARSWREDAERDTTRFGTPGYAPPEQYGFGQTGVTGDIYAAGMTIAFCCTGQDPTTTLREKGFTDPRIPAMLRPILVKATQLDPAARYQSAIEMKEAIRLAISGRRPAAETPTKGPRPSAPQSIPQDGRAHSVAMAPHAEAPFKRMLKYLWNATVIALYLFVVGVVAATVFQLITSPPPETLEAMQAHPGRFVLAVIELMVIFAMTTLGAYLALFKMHLRQVKPFCRFSWQQELPAGIGIIAFAALLIHIVNLFVTAS